MFLPNIDTTTFACAERAVSWSSCVSNTHADAAAMVRIRAWIKSANLFQLRVCHGGSLLWVRARSDHYRCCSARRAFRRRKVSESTPERWQHHVTVDTLPHSFLASSIDKNLSDNSCGTLLRYFRAFSQRTGVVIEVGCLALTYSPAIASSKAQAI
jgi:hypothetical protein